MIAFLLVVACAPPGECRDDLDCIQTYGGSFPVCLGSTCAECGSDAECDDGEACEPDRELGAVCLPNPP